MDEKRTNPWIIKSDRVEKEREDKFEGALEIRFVVYSFGFDLSFKNCFKKDAVSFRDISLLHESGKYSWKKRNRLFVKLKFGAFAANIIVRKLLKGAAIIAMKK